MAGRPDAAGRRPRVWTGDQAGVLFVGVAAWAVVPKLVQTLTAPKYRVRVDQALPAASPAAALVTDLLTVALLGWCLLVVLDGLRRNPRRAPGGIVLLLAPWAYVVLRGLSLGVVPGVSDLVYPAVAVAVWVLRPGLAHLRLLGCAAAGVAVVSLLVGVLLPARGLSRAAAGGISAEEGLLPVGVLVGVFTQGNTLGQYLLLGLPLVALVRGAVRHGLLLAATGAALVWSAARGEIAGALLLALVMGVLARLPRDRRSVAARLVLWGSFGLVAVLPLVTRDPTAYSNRGAIWRASLGLWREQPWFGHGAGYYGQLARTSANLGGTVYHGHNLLVHLLVTGGVVQAVLVGCLLLAAVERAAKATAGPAGSLAGVAVLLALAAASLLEISLVPGTTDVFAPVLLLPLATVLVGEPPSTPVVDPGPPPGNTVGAPGDLVSGVRA